jgi:uncharacterized membrane protein
MKADWRTEAPQWAILAAMFALALVSWTNAPDRIPVHWNVTGDIDRSAGSSRLLALPLVALGLSSLLRFLPRIDPGRANYPRFATAYTIIRIVMLLVLAGAYSLVHLWIRGRPVDVGVVAPMMIGLLFVVLGSLMGKLRPNWFVGIRTPWTLSSKIAWVRTHRIGGWLFLLLGATTLVAAPLLGPRATTWQLVGGAAAIGVWSMIYSYLVWRTDPHKVAPAGTLPADEE